MIAIRPAAPADSRPLAELRYDFRSALADSAEPRDGFVERCGRWMHDRLASGHWRAWIADRDGELVGQIWLQVIEKVPNPVGERFRHAYISNLFVTKDARGGVGTRLLEAALGHAKDLAVDRVVLWPTDRSRSLYLRYGFTPEGDVFEKKL